MLATIAENRVHVKLSRRNLKALQAMLDDRGSRLRSLGRAGDNGVVLVVEVEEDLEHYEGRTPGPSSRPLDIRVAGKPDDAWATVR